MTNTVRYDEAIHHGYAGKQYGVMGSNYEDINWFEPDEPKPTRAELEAIWATIQSEVEARDVKINRRFNYPSIDDLVVALWEKLVETDGLSSTDIDAIQALRQQVKTNFPNS